MLKININQDIPFNLQTIDLSGIDLDDRRYSFRFFQRPSDALIDSVRRYGIIYSPLVSIGADTYKVVDGFRRLEAARLCHEKKVLCKVYEGPFEEWDLACFILSLFLSAGPPHILDQGVILSRFCRLFDQDRVIDHILPLLGLPPNRKMLERLHPLSGMEEALGRALLDGRINHDMALRLMEMESDTREHISSLFLHFAFSQSKQFEILEYLMDISGRENRSLTEILKEAGWSRKRQEQTDENSVKAGEAFRRRLRERRNPIISGLEREWKNKIASLHLPPSVSLSPPPYFEGGTYRLSFTFNDLMGLQEKIEGLKDLIKKDEWRKIFPQ
ncbi:MAG: ParB N-terminal domain-containing protein [bacterium]